MRRKPTASNDWVKTGPHIMVVGSKEMLTGYPSGAKPDTSAPYVMWAGTPYAHLMVPVNTAPRTRAWSERRRGGRRIVGPGMLGIAAAHVLGDVAPAA